jgi:hypothetical protein
MTGPNMIIKKMSNINNGKTTKHKNNKKHKNNTTTPATTK